MILTDFYTRVAQKLHILAVGESLSAEDQDVLEAAYTSLHAELVTRGLATWSVSDDLPENVASPLIDILAAQVVDEFEVSEPRRSTMRMEGLFGLRPVSPAEARLRAAMALEYVPEPTVDRDFF